MTARLWWGLLSHLLSGQGLFCCQAGAKGSTDSAVSGCAGQGCGDSEIPICLEPLVHGR